MRVQTWIKCVPSLVPCYSVCPEHGKSGVWCPGGVTQSPHIKSLTWVPGVEQDPIRVLHAQGKFHLLKCVTVSWSLWHNLTLLSTAVYDFSFLCIIFSFTFAKAYVFELKFEMQKEPLAS